MCGQEADHLKPCSSTVLRTGTVPRRHLEPYAPDRPKSEKPKVSGPVGGPEPTHQFPDRTATRTSNPLS